MLEKERSVVHRAAAVAGRNAMGEILEAANIGIFDYVIQVAPKEEMILCRRLCPKLQEPSLQLYAKRSSPWEALAKLPGTIIIIPVRGSPFLSTK